MRVWRALLAAILAGLLCTAPALAQRKNTATKPTPIEVTARVLPVFAPREPERAVFGALRYRGGLVLSSRHPDFGGISGFRLDADGERFLAVTDLGMWLRGRITYSGDAPSGIADAEVAPLLAQDGRPITARRRWFDAEALAIDGGTAYVALERVHQILRYDIGRDGLFERSGLLARGRPIRVPAGFRGMPANFGIEGLAVPAEGMPHAGTLIALSERALDKAGNMRAFLIGGRTPGAFSVRRRDDFDITDAATLPGGDLLILERHFSWMRGVGMRIRRVPLDAVKPGAVVDGEVLIDADHGQEIDNMEALTMHRTAAGETVLTVVSDDNFFMLQRTLLLQFTLEE